MAELWLVLQSIDIDFWLAGMTAIFLLLGKQKLVIFDLVEVSTEEIQL